MHNRKHLPLISGTVYTKSWNSIFTAGQWGKYLSPFEPSRVWCSLSTLISSDEYCIFSEEIRSSPFFNSKNLFWFWLKFTFWRFSSKSLCYHLEYCLRQLFHLDDLFPSWNDEWSPKRKREKNEKRKKLKEKNENKDEMKKIKIKIVSSGWNWKM